MKISTFQLLILLGVVLSSCTTASEGIPARKKLFDDHWLFYYGERDGAHAADYDSSGWVAVDLPHDWSVGMPFTVSGGEIATGYTQGGVGWYKKTYTVPKKDAAKRIILYFEGIYMESEVWVNHQKVSFHPYGYTAYFCDITEFCHPPGKENIIAIKAKNEGKNSRWYAGSGIYRHVWLITTDKLHLDEWGIFVSTELPSTEKAIVHVTFNVINENNDLSDSEALITIKDEQGIIAASTKVRISLNPSETKTIRETVSVANPALWSVDSPRLYTADIELVSGGKMKDKLSTPFGIRSISFSATDGFLLNGKSLKLKGGCVHHDNGLLGAAAWDRAEERKVEILKANGFNAVRCAHNPPSEKFLEACDRLGLLVIDEAFDQWQKQKNPDDYHRYFDAWHERDLASMVLRDRNHPSVIMWSIGNEIEERSSTAGIEIARRLKGIVKKYDNTRPVTAAINDYWDNPHLTWETASPAAFDVLDVGGYNYMWWEYEHDAKQYPERIFYGSETTAMERTVNWDLVERYPQIMGDFIWSAIDYLGESGIGHALLVKEGEKEPPMFLDSPWFNAWCGDIDICGNKKPQAALRDILWNNSKIEMLVHRPVPVNQREKISYWGWPDEEASWNWSGHEGTLLDVKVYTRYPSVRLYLNGIQIAEKETGKKDPLQKYAAVFQVKYAPGELKAVGVNQKVEMESTTLTTTGEPARVRLTADRLHLKHAKNDLSYVSIELVDKGNHVVTTSDVKLELTVSGKGKLLASGNASPTDRESFRSASPKTFKGKALAILQPTADKGNITLEVHSTFGKESVTISVE